MKGEMWKMFTVLNIHGLDPEPIRIKVDRPTNTQLKDTSKLLYI